MSHIFRMEICSRGIVLFYGEKEQLESHRDVKLQHQPYDPVSVEIYPNRILDLLGKRNRIRPIKGAHFHGNRCALSVGIFTLEDKQRSFQDASP